MRAAVVVSVGLALASSAVAPPAAAQDTVMGFVARTHDGMPYRLFVPPAHDKTQQIPLVLFLHGAGERGTNNTSQISGPGTNQLPLLVTSAANRAKYPAIVVAPQCPPAPAQWVDWPWADGSYELDKVPESAPLKKAIAIVEAVRAEYNADPSRIYVMGMSMGGYGTWDALMRHPELFAAAVETDGGGAPKSVDRIKHIPVWSHHVANDDVVPVGSDREMYAALAAAGGSPTYTEYASGGHSGWILASRQPDLLPWLFAQRRGQAPTAPADAKMQPNGGAFPGPLKVTVTSSLIGAQIRYGLGNEIPTTSAGQSYSDGIMVTPPATVRVVAFTSPADATKRVSVFHAASFAAGTAAPDAGAPDASGTARPAPGAGGGSPAAGTGGSSAGAGGSSVAGAAGATAGRSGAAGSSGTGGSSKGGSPAGGTGGDKSSDGDGCSIGNGNAPSALALLLAAIATALAARRRRARARR